MVKQLITSSLQFEEAVKKLEKFREAGPGLVCMKCCRISHKHLGHYRNKPEKYIIGVCMVTFLSSRFQDIRL